MKAKQTRSALLNVLAARLLPIVMAEEKILPMMLAVKKDVLEKENEGRADGFSDFETAKEVREYILESLEDDVFFGENGFMTSLIDKVEELAWKDIKKAVGALPIKLDKIVEKKPSEFCTKCGQEKPQPNGQPASKHRRRGRKAGMRHR